MAEAMTKTQARHYRELLERHFSPYEARELSVLPKSDPVLKVMVRDRIKRWERFTEIVQRKLDSGQWRPDEVGDKWFVGLGRWYTKYGWRVKYGAIGEQPRRKKGLVNVWAAYRSYEKISPPKTYKSPWELRRVFRKPRLEKDLVRIQTAEKRGGMNRSTVQRWIAEKEQAVKRARGQRKEQLAIELHRLEKLLEGGIG